MSESAFKLGFSGKNIYTSISRCLNLKYIALEIDDSETVIHLLQKKYLFFSIVGDGFRGTFIPYSKEFETSSSKLKASLPTFDHLEFRRFKRDYLLEKSLRINFNSFEIKNLETIIIELEHIHSTQVLSLLPSKTRNMIRKAQKNELVPEIGAFKLSDVDPFYTMLKDTYSRSNGRLFHRYNFFKNLSENFASSSLTSIKVLHNGEIQAWGLFLKVNSIQYYLSGASTESGNRLGANNFLQYLAIVDAAQAKCAFYDMGGSGHKGIDRFKLSFGGRRVKTVRYIVRKRFGRICAPFLSRMGL